jgi:chromosome partitioning protein
MGFLSRKNKFKAAPVVDEQHPIVEELEEMEELVPERQDDETSERLATGPVAAGDPPPPAVAKASSEAGPPTAPPVEERTEISRERPVEPETTRSAPEAAETVGSSAVAVKSEPEPEPERFMPRDLLAPSRHEPAVAVAEPEEAVEHADVIAFANQKGGVAKTTTTLNLAVAFAESGYRVLCVDLDPQGNLTMSQGIDPDKVEKSLYDVLVHDMPMAEIIQHREIDIAVASIDLAGAEIAMSTKIGRERSLEKSLKEVSGNYDFVCIDTPPSLGLLTINALTAANKVIVPVQCEYLSMRGLVQLQNTLKMIQENLNPAVRIEGILPTMLDTRTVHAKEAVEILEENFGELVFKSRIRKAIKFAEAPVKGASVLKYDPQSNAAGYYRDLAKEVLAHESA